MFPIKVTIRDTFKSQALEDHIIKKAEKLEHYNQRISTCRIVVDMPQKHKHQGKLFRTSIELIVQGKEFVVNRKLDEDVYASVAQAFEAIERKLEDFSGRRVTSIRHRKRASDVEDEVVKSMQRERNSSTMTFNDDIYLENEFDYEDINQLAWDMAAVR